MAGKGCFEIIVAPSEFDMFSNRKARKGCLLVDFAIGCTGIARPILGKGTAQHCIERSHCAECTSLRCESTTGNCPKLDVFVANCDKLKNLAS